MATKKQMTDKEVTEVESRLIPILLNEESDPVTLAGGEKVRFKRPTLPGKYKYQVWLSKQLKEIGLDESVDTEGATAEIVFYWNYFGLANCHVVELVLPDGTFYEYDPKVDTDYKFLLEKYVTEEIYKKGGSDETFIVDVIEKFVDWQREAAVSPDEIKNS